MIKTMVAVMFFLTGILSPWKEKMLKKTEPWEDILTGLKGLLETDPKKKTQEACLMWKKMIREMEESRA